MEKNLASYKSLQFVTEHNRSSMLYEIKRARAVWDPSLAIPGTERRGGFRCPVGTRYGGQITDRFGRQCGWGVARRLANEISDLGERLENVGDARRDRKLRKRNERMAGRLAGAPGAIERAAGRVGDVLDVTGREGGGRDRVDAEAPRPAGRLERAAGRLAEVVDPDKPTRNRRAPARNPRPAAPQRNPRRRDGGRELTPDNAADAPARPARPRRDEKDPYVENLRTMSDADLEKQYQDAFEAVDRLRDAVEEPRGDGRIGMIPLSAQRANAQGRLDKVRAELNRRGKKAPRGRRQVNAKPRPRPAAARRPRRNLRDSEERRMQREIDNPDAPRTGPDAAPAPAARPRPAAPRRPANRRPRPNDVPEPAPAKPVRPKEPRAQANVKMPDFGGEGWDAITQPDGSIKYKKGNWTIEMLPAQNGKFRGLKANSNDDGVPAITQNYNGPQGQGSLNRFLRDFENNALRGFGNEELAGGLETPAAKPRQGILGRLGARESGGKGYPPKKLAEFLGDMHDPVMAARYQRQQDEWSDLIVRDMGEWDKPDLPELEDIIRRREGQIELDRDRLDMEIRRFEKNPTREQALVVMARNYDLTIKDRVHRSMQQRARVLRGEERPQPAAREATPTRGRTRVLVPRGRTRVPVPEGQSDNAANEANAPAISPPGPPRPPNTRERLAQLNTRERQFLKPPSPDNPLGSGERNAPAMPPPRPPNTRQRRSVEARVALQQQQEIQRQAQLHRQRRHVEDSPFVDETRLREILGDKFSQNVFDEHQEWLEQQNKRGIPSAMRQWRTDREMVQELEQSLEVSLQNQINAKSRLIEYVRQFQDEPDTALAAQIMEVNISVQYYRALRNAQGVRLRQIRGSSPDMSPIEMPEPSAIPDPPGLSNISRISTPSGTGSPRPLPALALRIGRSDDVIGRGTSEWQQFFEAQNEEDIPERVTRAMRAVQNGVSGADQQFNNEFNGGGENMLRIRDREEMIRKYDRGLVALDRAVDAKRREYDAANPAQRDDYRIKQRDLIEAMAKRKHYGQRRADIDAVLAQPAPEPLNPEMGRKAGERVKEAIVKRQLILGKYLDERYGVGNAPWKEMTLERRRNLLAKAFDRNATAGERAEAKRALELWAEAMYSHDAILGNNGKTYRIKARATLGQSGEIEVYADIERMNADGSWVTAGSSSRNIFLESGYIKNATMFIRGDADKNNGIQTIYNQHAFMYAKAAGFDKVKVGAADDGPYVWGRIGFDSDTPIGNAATNRMNEQVLAFRRGDPSIIKNAEDANIIEYLILKHEEDPTSVRHMDFIYALSNSEKKNQTKKRKRDKELRDWFVMNMPLSQGVYHFDKNLVKDDPRD